MYSTSQFNDLVPQFTDGEYAITPVNPLYVEKPSCQCFQEGTRPLETLPTQWWNWFNQEYTRRFNNINTTVSNVVAELNTLLTKFEIEPNSSSTSQLYRAFNGYHVYDISNQEKADEFASLSAIDKFTFVHLSPGANSFTLNVPRALRGQMLVIWCNTGYQQATITINAQTPIYMKGGQIITLLSPWSSSTPEWHLVSGNLKFMADKLYPVGTVYQNATCADSPETLIGYGCWTQITDKFLVARGSEFETTGGCSCATLAVCNLPSHYHETVEHCHLAPHSHSAYLSGAAAPSSAFWTMLYAGTLNENCGLFSQGYMCGDCRIYALSCETTSTADATIMPGKITFGYTPHGEIDVINCNVVTTCANPNTCCTGSGCSFSIIPPYCAVYTWKRTS